MSNKKNKILTSMQRSKFDALPAYDKQANMSKLKHFLKQVGSSTDMAQITDPNVLAAIANNNDKGGVVVINSNSGRADASQVLNAAARFNLKITRLTAAINAALPFPIFGGQSESSDWINALSAYLPAGCTYVVARMANKKGLQITYTVGANVDIITIECRNKPYISLLEGCKNSTMNLTEIKMKLTNADHQAQFEEEIVPYFDSLFGRKDVDSFTPDDFFRDDQEQDSIRTIRQNIEIEPERTLVAMVTPIAGVSFTMNTIVEQYTTVRK